MRVSAVASVPEVRAHLIAQQQAIIAAAEPGIVAEGRDIGTVVAPGALVKVFLTAAGNARAARHAGDQGTSVADTEADQDRRDRLDAAQSAMAADALLIDSTDLTLAEVIDAIAALARDACGHARLHRRQKLMTKRNESVAPATRTPDPGRWVDAGWDDADEDAVRRPR